MTVVSLRTRKRTHKRSLNLDRVQYKTYSDPVLIGCQNDCDCRRILMPDETAISSVHALIGDAGFERLVGAFYRQVPADDILGPLYPKDDLVGAEQRLRDFLIFRFGGSDRYLHSRGHPQLRGRHVPFAIDARVRDRWVSLMDRALREAELPDAAIAIMQPCLHEVATFLINRSPSPGLVN